MYHGSCSLENGISFYQPKRCVVFYTEAIGEIKSNIVFST